MNVHIIFTVVAPLTPLICPDNSCSLSLETAATSTLDTEEVEELEEVVTIL